VRGVIVDETGAPVPTGKIRGMLWQWRPTCGARSYGVRGHARKGEFVFRYRREITPPFPGPIRAGEGRPDLELSFWVEAPGFAHEEFVAQREISAAVDRGDCVDGLTIVLQRSASVEGTVFGPDGKPRAGIDVGVADHPLAFCSEYRTRRETDEQGRFRLDDVDPRRRLWLHVRNKELLGRPLPLGNLSADAVTHRTIYVERIHEVDVRFEIDATEGAARIRIDFGPTHFMKEGEFRVLLDSGPHLFEFKDARGEVVKRIRLWIEAAGIVRTSSHVAAVLPPPTHGEFQLCAMLRDRPSLRSMVTPGDELWEWTVNHFDGVGTGFPVFWDAAIPTKPFGSDCRPPWRKRGASIRVRGLPERLRTRPDAASEVSPGIQELYWTRVVYELLNLEGTPQFTKAHRDARAGRLTCGQFIEQYTRAEHQAVLRLGEFYSAVWAPFAVRIGRPLRPSLWSTQAPERYEDWIALYSDSRDKYPWVPYGKYFEKHIRRAAG